MEPQKPLVLIADDERSAVALLTRILERDGFAVESARDGESALEKARTLRPDLILMDVMMPKMNGFEVVQYLREDPITTRIPIIFVTAAAREPSDVAHGFKLGADDYIRKPYNYHELLARAHSKMRARQLEDRLQRRSEELEAMVRIGGELNQRLALSDLVDLILVITRQELDADHVELYLFDDRQKLVLSRDTVSGSRELDATEAHLNNENTIAGWVRRAGEPILIPQIDGTQTFARSLHEVGLSSAVAAPLIHHGMLLGILVVAHAVPNHFSENDLRLLRSIGEQAALAVRNAQLYAELQSYAQNLETMVEARTEELRAAHAQLIRTEKLAALGRLAAGVAHEINNPLQPILNCLEVAIEDIESQERVDAEVLRVAETEVQRIRSIVSRLLDFARPNTQDTTEIDLHSLVQEVLMLTDKQLERAHIHKITALEPVRPLVGNPTQLKQVVLNLVLNAMQAMPDGGSLTVSVQSDDEGATIEVQDTGIGMDNQTISQIFDPFYSTKEEGTGLGLAVSYGIVEGHGGNIRVRSEPGEGSRFSIWLPYPQA